MKDLADYEIDVVKFWKWVSIAGPDECWNWTGALNTGGYGLFSVRSTPDQYEASGRTRSQVLAHRIAFHVGVAELDAGLHICHTCDNPRCCNPGHLFRGSMFDNVQDMISKRRAWWQQAAE